jgi:hypothetical protein
MRCADQERRSLGVQTGRVEENTWDPKMGRREEEGKSGRRGRRIKKREALDGGPGRQPYWRALDGQNGDQTIV